MPGPRLSSRLDFSSPANPITLRLAARRAAGASIVDLTESNPTRAGLAAHAEALAAALAAPGATHYDPDPRGLASARAAIAAHEGLPADSLLLTASTSEAYALLFKVLCDPGDVVLAPAPSYPLFEHLAGLEGVRLRSYPLVAADGWRTDLAALDALFAAEPRARAIVAVSPANPTGHYLRRDELAALAARGLPVLVDEVFAAYPAAPSGPPADAALRASTLLGASPAPVVSLGGLSKSAALPQVKLAWISVGGAASAAAPLLAALELAADASLSVATPVQLAAPALLALGDTLRLRVAARVAENRATLRALVTSLRPDVTVLPAEAGWSALLRFPATHTDETLVLAALDRGVLVAPGHFFDLPGGPFLVVSLLPEPAVFRDALGTVLTP